MADVLMVMVFFELIVEFFKCCWCVPRFGVDRVDGVILVCFVCVDCVFAVVDYVVFVSSLSLLLSVLFVESCGRWVARSGYHSLVIVVRRSVPLFLHLCSV